MNRFILTILGSGAALPTPIRNSTSQILNINERFFLIDCGEGTQLQLRRFKAPCDKIDHILISHLHGDHYFGLFGLLSTFSLTGRKKPLHLYAHPILEEIINTQLKYAEPLHFELVFHPLNSKKNEIIFEDKCLTVETIPLRHRIPVCGFLFREKPKERNMKKEAILDYNIPIRCIPDIKKGADFITEEGKTIKNEIITSPPPKPRSYAFCTDTVYREQIIPIIENVDLLYHEATFMHNKIKQAKSTYHTTTIQAATLAQKAKVKKLIIGHFSARYKNAQELEDEAQTVFTNTIAAKDGLEVNIN